MRIAWVSYDFEEYSALHINELCKEHDVLMVMPNDSDGGDRYSIDPSVQQFRFDKPRLRQPLKQLASVRSLVAAINQFDPDVIHFQQGHLWFNMALQKLKRYPLVLTVHDPRHHAGDVESKRTPQWMIDYGFRKADQVIVHGDLLAKQVQELFGFDETQTHVIPHVAMGQTDAASRVPEEPGTILFFGRIFEYKGLQTLIAAEPLIAKQFAEFKIIIAGTGDDFDQYTAKMTDSERYEIHNRWISDEERATMFQRSAVVVLPYREATQSGVVPVAYSFRKPVVATKVGALVECVQHGTTGLLVTPDHPQQLADAILQVLSSPDEGHRMGIAGHEWLNRESSPEVVATKTAAVYKTAINKKNNHQTQTPVAAG